MVVGKVWIVYEILDGYEVLGWLRKAWDLGGGHRVGLKG